jgi:hypothetical protein
MLAVRHLRSIRVRSYVLPLLLGALTLRFLIPTGFMPDASDGTTLRVAMCSTDKGQSELIEIPGEPAKPHCDHCLMPSLGPPFSPFNIAGPIQVPQRSLLPQHESQIPEVPLARAQIPRAPPSA